MAAAGCRIAADGLADDGTEACGMADDMTASDCWQCRYAYQTKISVYIMQKAHVAAWPYKAAVLTLPILMAFKQGRFLHIIHTLSKRTCP